MYVDGMEGKHTRVLPVDEPDEAELKKDGRRVPRLWQRQAPKWCYCDDGLLMLLPALVGVCTPSGLLWAASFCRADKGQFVAVWGISGHTGFSLGDTQYSEGNSWEAGGGRQERAGALTVTVI
ncbi:hypothetical protein B0H10DRAFT_1966845 [Mycena sp. CBHHK59/15]|nr:hypothetical protein B0H10DRAFT_1966845 [Mycena sp. CBHHK59/15]